MLESEQVLLDGMSIPKFPRTSVVVHLHLKEGSPALAQTLTVPWDVLERAQKCDEAPSELLSDVLLAGMLADPIVQLVMLSDSVSESEVLCVVKAARAHNTLQFSCVDHSKHARLPCQPSRPPSRRITRLNRISSDRRATDRGENEGMALLPT
jgi:hypothetical protein